MSTKVKLDREERQNYTLILDIEDLGSPPQQTSTLMHVVVTDVDDHAPVFRRQRVSLLIRHSSEIRDLRSAKCSSETLQNLLYFMYKKTHVVFFVFIFVQLYIFTL